jgi:hypothetical protein
LPPGGCCCGTPGIGQNPQDRKLSPAAVRRLEAYARRHKLPHFSAASEAASELLVK